MRILLFCLAVGLLCFGCSQKETAVKKEKSLLIGTWKMYQGMTVEGQDSLVTDYTKDQEFIKIINKTHFSFLRHDLNKGVDSTNAVFVAGGGRYTVKENTYTESLDYCNYRAWEGHKFEMQFEIKGDTLITRGIEKVEELNVDRVNIEKYLRVK